MKESVPRKLNDAALCRKNRWKVGMMLVGDEGYGETVIQLTAIGIDHILAREISHKGIITNGDEGHWTLSCRDWKRFHDRRLEQCYRFGGNQ